MTAVNKLEREFNEVKKLAWHEDQLVNELREMSKSFELFTKDKRSVANFFDYLNSRLVETCKKVEIEYFAIWLVRNQSEELNDCIKPIETKASIKTGTTEKAVLTKESKVDGQTKVKLVENYDSDSVDEKYNITNVSGERLMTKEGSEIDAKPLCDTKELNSMANVVKPDRFGAQDDVNRENLHGGAKKRTTESDEKVVKKHKIEDDEQKVDITLNLVTDDELEEGEIFDDIFNTNPNVHFTKNRSRCILCKKLHTHMVEHYTKIHPDCEIFISRPSPSMAEKIRRRTETFTFISKLNCISGLCFFCELPLRLSLADWKTHLLNHTGEQLSLDAFTGRQLTALMCKSCNYIQTDIGRMTRHLRKEHKIEIDNAFDKIVLIPDLKPLKPIISKNSTKFIDEKARFTCGVGWCEDRLNGYANFKAHLRQKHCSTEGEPEPFGCPHCDEIILPTKKTFHNDIGEHLQLHGEHMYTCLYCEGMFSEANDAILHVFRQHPVKNLKFHYYTRESADTLTCAEEFHIMLQCNSCKDIFYTQENALNHFKVHHKSLNIDLTVNILSKFTAPDSTTTLSLQKNQLTLRRFFECSQCDETRYNEVSLINHFTRAHPTQPMLLKPGDVFLKSIDDKEKPNTLRNCIQSIFYCYHCYENKNRQFIGFGDCSSVLTHWTNTHSAAPFRYYISKIAKCFHCGLMGTFQALKLHQHNDHPQKTLVIVDLLNAQKCGLCPYIGEDMECHFQEKHDIAETSMFCPIPLDEENLIVLVEMKNLKKRLCKICGLIFDTKRGFINHHKKHHDKLSTEVSVEKFYDKSIRLMTGCCREIIDSDKLAKHLTTHQMLSQCPECSFKALDLYELTSHHLNMHNPGNNVAEVFRSAMLRIYWNTKVLFGNGLILSKHNLLRTKYDDSKQFEIFVNKIIENNEQIL